MRTVELNLTYTPTQLDIFFSNASTKYLIIPKGRRFGATQGAAHAFVEYCLDGITPLLWVDTINGNIDRYYERYFLPVLSQLPASRWAFNMNKKIMKVYSSVIDFRSADSPESIEGFGYKVIFLNEAGIILKDDYLYSNSILPMLLDYPDSRLIAAGVPKGKFKKNGQKHKFFELWEACQAGKKGYKGLHYTSYDNPRISRAEVDDLRQQMSEAEALQEIFGEFVEFQGNNPFAFHFGDRHLSPEAVFDPRKTLHVSLDFNRQPFAAIFAHLWRDDREHCHVFDEASIPNGNIQKMIEHIRSKYAAQLPSCLITGDKMGDRSDIGQRDLASYYNQLERGLGVRPAQIVTPANPTHENSKADCNYFLFHYPDFKINPSCVETVRDLRMVQVDAYNSIIKGNRKDMTQKADHCDCFTGDTLVTTEFGQRRIDEVRVGEKVLTRKGLRRVTDKWNSIAEVMEFETSSGAKVSCTKDHKFISDDGLCEIFSIFTENKSVWRLSSTTELSTGCTENTTPAPSQRPGQGTHGRSTGRSGTTITVPFRRAWKCITRIMTGWTTGLRTSPSCPRERTANTTGKSRLRTTGKGFYGCSKRDRRPPGSGTGVPEDSRGTGSTRQTSGSATESTERESVIFAASNTQQDVTCKGFATPTARQRGGGNSNRTSLNGSASAARSSQLLNTSSEGFVHAGAALLPTLTAEKVKSAKHIGTRTVWDITVEGEHEFFANGILVHNCFRYLINTFLWDWINAHQKMKHR